LERAEEFIPHALAKLAEVRRRIDLCGREIMLEVDGGVNADNIAGIARAGADTFVAGSAIFGAKDYKATIAAMRAGKHVLVEKPMALTRRDAEDMARVAQHCGVRLGVGFHLRHHAGHQRLREGLREGAIGALSHIHLEWSTRSMGTDNWRASAKEGWFALAALGSHALDLVAWLTSSDRANVFATKGFSATGRDERVTMHVELEHGVTASIRVSVADAPTKYFRLSGTKGTIECRDTLGGRGEGEIVLPDGTRLGFTPANPYAAQIAAFVAAVREERDPDASARDGALNVRWLERAGESMNASIP